LTWRQYADAADYLYDPRYHWERAEHRWHDERAGQHAERRVEERKERAEHLRHEWHEHVDHDFY